MMHDHIAQFFFCMKSPQQSRWRLTHIVGRTKKTLHQHAYPLVYLSLFTCRCLPVVVHLSWFTCCHMSSHVTGSGPASKVFPEAAASAASASGAAASASGAAASASGAASSASGAASSASGAASSGTASRTAARVGQRLKRGKSAKQRRR